MDQLRVWYDRLCDTSDDSCELLVRGLSSVGIDLCPRHDHARSGAGIVFFDRMSDRLIEALRQYVGDTGNRVLAIPLADDALSGAETWRLLRAGAADVLAFSNAPALAAAIAERLRRWDAIERLVQTPLVRNNLVGRSPAWLAVLRQVVEVAHFTTASVLIYGESGTGKELIARLIHTLDQRDEKNELVILDCTTVSPELAGSEFFGHERGAFTNAINARDGAFALADKGTLFLDEVGELTTPLQAELLRVVQERTYKRVGGNQWKHTDFRLVCATNRDLMHEEAQGRFRRDFYYRIAAFTCKLPALRERREDILPLARNFWKQLRPGTPEPEFDAAVRDYLLTRDYPGNVRDLKQLIARMSYRHVGDGLITAGDIPDDDRPLPRVDVDDWRDDAFEHAVRHALALGMGLKDIGRAAEDAAERIALEDEEGNLQRAARKLGVTDRALQMRRANRRQQGMFGDSA
jgi:transcriptional regulator with GAF, ATPase, and Fis domain